MEVEKLEIVMHDHNTMLCGISTFVCPGDFLVHVGMRLLFAWLEQL